MLGLVLDRKEGRDLRVCAFCRAERPAAQVLHRFIRLRICADCFGRARETSGLPDRETQIQALQSSEAVPDLNLAAEFLFRCGKGPDASGVARRGIELAQRSGDLRGELRILKLLVHAQRADGAERRRASKLRRLFETVSPIDIPGLVSEPELQEVLRVASERLDAKSTDPYMMVLAGEIASMLGGPDDAKREWVQARDLLRRRLQQERGFDLDSLRANYQIAQIDWRLGDMARAREKWSEVTRAALTVGNVAAATLTVEMASIALERSRLSLSFEEALERAIVWADWFHLQFQLAQRYLKDACAACDRLTRTTDARALAKLAKASRLSERQLDVLRTMLALEVHRKRRRCFECGSYEGLAYWNRRHPLSRAALCRNCITEIDHRLWTGNRWTE